MTIPNYPGDLRSSNQSQKMDQINRESKLALSQPKVCIKLNNLTRIVAMVFVNMTLLSNLSSCTPTDTSKPGNSSSLVMELKALTDFQSIRNSSRVTAVHYYKSSDPEVEQFTQDFARLAESLSGVISFASLNITDTQLAKANTPFVRLYFGNRSNLAPVHINIDTEAGINWMLVGKQILEKVAENLLLPFDAKTAEFELILSLDSNSLLDMVYGSQHPWAILLYSSKACQKPSESLGYSCERMETNFKYMSTVFSKPSATIKHPLVFARANCDESSDLIQLCRELATQAKQTNKTLEKTVFQNVLLLVDPSQQEQAGPRFYTASVVSIDSNDVLKMRSPLVEFANQTRLSERRTFSHLANSKDFEQHCLNKRRLGCLIIFVPPVTDDESFLRFQKEYYQLETIAHLFARYKVSHLFSFVGHQPEFEANLPLGKSSAYGAAIIYPNGGMVPLPSASGFDSRRFKQFLTSALAGSLPKMKLPPITPPIRTVVRWDDPSTLAEDKNRENTTTGASADSQAQPQTENTVETGDAADL